MTSNEPVADKNKCSICDKPYYNLVNNIKYCEKHTPWNTTKPKADKQCSN